MQVQKVHPNLQSLLSVLLLPPNHPIQTLPLAVAVAVLCVAVCVAACSPAAVFFGPVPFDQNVLLGEWLGKAQARGEEGE